MPDPMDVLIVGAGPVGLTLAALLARNGVGVTVVEARPGLSPQPRVRVIEAAAMEVFHALGIEQGIRSQSQGGERLGTGETVSDPGAVVEDHGEDLSHATACPAAYCDLSVLEPVLLARAEALGVNVRFGTALATLEDAETVVRVGLVSGEATEVAEARWLVGCDGARGTVAREGGFGLSGPGMLGHRIDLLFDTDLAPEAGEAAFDGFHATGADLRLWPRADGRWRMTLDVAPETLLADEIDDAFLQDLVWQAAGDDEVWATLLDAAPWQPRAETADRYRRGRLLLAGDAAHTLPPYRGFGLAVGIGDAANLGWKLARVVRGLAPVELLDSYEAERRSVARTLTAMLRDGAAPAGDVLFRLSAEGLLDDGYELTPGRPMPHMMAELRGQRRAVRQLPGRELLLLSPDPAWVAAAGDVAPDLRALRIGHELTGDKLMSGLGTGWRGALLLRPDGLIAWRSTDAEAPRDQLAAALLVLGLTVPQAVAA